MGDSSASVFCPASANSTVARHEISKMDRATHHHHQPVLTVPIPHAPGFRCAIFDAQQLSQQPYLEYLRSMINEAYWASHSKLLDRCEDSQRFHDAESVLSCLGVHGRCCLVFRDEDTQMLRPVATAAMKYFNPDLGGPPLDPVEDNGQPSSVSSPNGLGTTVSATNGDKNLRGLVATGYQREPVDLLDIEHWEPTAVALAPDDPSLQKLGLAAHCVTQLERDVVARYQSALVEERRKYDDAAPPRPRELTIWVRATTISNGPYWQRRGFHSVLVDRYPKGFWGAVSDFELMTLKRQVALPMYCNPGVSTD
jgi:hypothetical protein